MAGTPRIPGGLPGGLSARSGFPGGLPGPLAQTGFDARRALGVVWKWRWLIVAGVLAGLAVGLIDTLQRRPVYKATAQVLVERQGPKLLKFVDSDGWVLPPDVPFDTHSRLMRTSPVAARVAKATGEIPPGSGDQGGPSTDGVPNTVVDALLGGLETRPSRDELGIVEVSFSSGDPQRAARMANAFAEEYIAERVDASLGLSRNVTRWVDARLGEQKARLAESEARLQEFRETWSYLGPESAATHDGLAELRAELAETARNRRELERQRDQLRAHRQTLEDASAVPEVAQSAVFQKLALQRSEAAEALAEASRELGPKHPEMRTLQSRHDSAERGMREEIDRIERAARLGAERLAAREAAQGRSLREATRTAIEAGNRATEFAALERDVDLNRQLYDTLLRRLKSLGLATDADRSNIRIVERARVPSRPISGPSLLHVLKALAAGLLFATGIAFLWEYVDSSVKSPEELEGDFALPVLGVIPSLPAGPTGNGASWRSAPPLLTDAFGAVRSALVLSSPESPPQVLLISSAGAGEGKSTVALQLAAAMARDGVPTLLVEADLRHPVLHRRMGIEHRPGLTELLTSRAPLESALRKTDLPWLSFLPSGAPPPDPSELLGSSRMAEIIAEARSAFPRIIIDSAPVFAAAEMLALADATTLAATCDGVVLVVRSRRTSRQAIAGALSRLETVHARILGAVLNDWRRPGPVRGGVYYDGYGANYGYAPAPPEPAGASDANGNGHGAGTAEGGRA